MLKKAVLAIASIFTFSVNIFAFNGITGITPFPAGSTGAVQFNDQLFGGSTNFTFDKTTRTLKVTTAAANIFIGKFQGDGTALSGIGMNPMLTVGTGSAVAMNTISSPTYALNFDSATIMVQLTGGGTAYVSLGALVALLNSSKTFSAAQEFSTITVIVQPSISDGITIKRSTAASSINSPQLKFEALVDNNGIFAPGVDLQPSDMSQYLQFTGGTGGSPMSYSMLWVNTNNQQIMQLSQAGDLTLNNPGATSGAILDTGNGIFKVLRDSSIVIGENSTNGLSILKVNDGYLDSRSIVLVTSGTGNPSTYKLFEIRGSSSAFYNQNVYFSSGIISSSANISGILSDTGTFKSLNASSFTLTNATICINGNCFFTASTGMPANSDLILHVKNGFGYWGGDSLGGGSGSGGGTPVLAVGTGSVAAMNTISSPTYALNFDSTTFLIKLTGGGTAYVSLGALVALLNSTQTWTAPETFASSVTFKSPISSVTIQGNLIVIGSMTSMGVITSTMGFIGATSTFNSVAVYSNAPNFPGLAFYFADNPTTGIYGNGTGSVGLVANGSLIVSAAPQGMTMVHGNIFNGLGTDLNPSYSFSSDNNSGMSLNFSPPNSYVGFSNGGVSVLKMYQKFSEAISSFTSDILITSTNGFIGGSSTFTSANIASLAASSFTLTNATICINGNCFFTASTGMPANSDLILHVKNGFGYWGGDSLGGGSGSGGGGSPIIVSTGSFSNAATISSPTFYINFSSDNFSASLTGGATAFINLSTGLLSLISSLSQSTTIINNSESPDISARPYFLTNVSSGGPGSYFLLQSTPSNLAETIKTKSISSANGLVMLSSHVTNTGDPGVRKLPAGAWSFLTYVDLNSVAGLTQLVITVSTIGVDGTLESEILSSTSSDIEDLAVNAVDVTAIQQNDVFVSTSDRLLVKYWARTNNVLSVNVDLYLAGTSHASHLNSPVGNIYKFTQLSDAPNTLVGGRGKYLSVNDDQTALVFISSSLGGDNFGSHVSTMPANFPFGITASSIVVISSLNVMGVVTSTTGFIGASSTFNFVNASVGFTLPIITQVGAGTINISTGQLIYNTTDQRIYVGGSSTRSLCELIFSSFSEVDQAVSTAATTNEYTFVSSSFTLMPNYFGSPYPKKIQLNFNTRFLTPAGPATMRFRIYIVDASGNKTTIFDSAAQAPNANLAAMRLCAVDIYHSGNGKFSAASGISSNPLQQNTILPTNVTNWKDPLTFMATMTYGSSVSGTVVWLNGFSVVGY